MSERPDTDRIAALFEGYSGASGTHGLPDRDPNGLKWSIKKTAKTLSVGPTMDFWQQHVDGRRPLGVVPIRDDSTCLWGSIDIDKYNIDLLEVIGRVDAMKLPLVPCRSKSGGLHLFVFASEPVQAELMQSALRRLAAALGHNDAEIFPKQTSIGAGTSGNWMVMPYFGGTFGDKLKYQYGLKKTGAEMTLGEFLNYAERHKVTEQQLARLVAMPPVSRGGHMGTPHACEEDAAVPYSDGPPCLQAMSIAGFPEGGRNNTVFHLGVFLKKAFPGKWKEMLAEENIKRVKPPLPVDEVAQIIKQLDKRDYDFKCNDQPMQSHCDSIACRGRKYGVGDGTDIPNIVSLRKIMSEQPIWYVTIDGSNGEMKIKDIRDLTDHRRFADQCAKQLNAIFPPMKDALWKAILRGVFASKLTEEQASEDATSFGLFKEAIGTFLTNRTRGTRREDLLRDVSWEDEVEGRYYFKLAPLIKFLDREGMRELTRNDITEFIRKMGGPKVSKDTSIKKTSVKLWWVPSSAVRHAPELDIPAPPPEEI